MNTSIMITERLLKNYKDGSVLPQDIIYDEGYIEFRGDEVVFSLYGHNRTVTKDDFFSHIGPLKPSYNSRFVVGERILEIKIVPSCEALIVGCDKSLDFSATNVTVHGDSPILVICLAPTAGSNFSMTCHKENTNLEVVANYVPEVDEFLVHETMRSDRVESETTIHIKPDHSVTNRMRKVKAITSGDKPYVLLNA